MSIRKRSWKSAGEDKTAWVIDYVDQHGKRRLKTFTLKKDAEAWATNALHEVSGVSTHLTPKQLSKAFWIRGLTTALMKGLSGQRLKNARTT